MSERLSFYQLFAEKEYSVIIPIIQRDYAQGRTSAKEVRENFLDSLKKYLDDNIPFRDLDFVYGDLNNGKDLLPLDGQQRLTTLFLLHWYLAVYEGRLEELRAVMFKDSNSKFTYKTRQSAGDFCNALLLNTVDLNALISTDVGEANSFSKTIKDSPWYFLSWNKDPTIQSMLRMLDAIHNKFEDPQGMYDKMTSLERPIITFQFLSLSNYGLTDDLYIKMNSRGKPLTRFENFKAKFEQFLTGIETDREYHIDMAGHIKPIDCAGYFSHKMDTDWADFFWNFKDNVKNTFDDQVMNLISVIAINQYALTHQNVRPKIDNQSTLPFSFYLQQDHFFVETLFDVFDIFSENPAFKNYLSFAGAYNQIDSFQKIINNNFNDAGFSERIKFFGYYSFLVQWNGIDKGFSDWMRLLENLVENTAPYNDDTAFINSIRTIKKMLPYSNCILEFLAENPQLSGFNPSQIKEEIIKAHLILKGQHWSVEVYAAEKHEYFKGQITFAIAFAGIEESYNKDPRLNWDEEVENKYLEKFKNYISKVFALFNSEGLVKPAETGHLFHRAILTKGDYLLPAKSNFSFLVNKERDISWKRLLLGDDFRSGKRGYVKMLLDDERFDENDLSSLNVITADLGNEIKHWVKLFIIQPALFDYLGPWKYIRFTTDQDIDLLKSVRLSGEHVELHTYAMFLAGTDSINCLPFNRISNNPATGDDYHPSITFKGWEYLNERYNLIVYHFHLDKYMLRFRRDDGSLLVSDKITEQLVAEGFDVAEGKYQKVSNQMELKSNIEALCKRLAEIRPITI